MTKTLKVGMEVRIRKDLHVGDMYDGFSFNHKMCKYRGQLGIVVDVWDNGKWCYLDIDNSWWVWNLDMLEYPTTKKHKHKWQRIPSTTNREYEYCNCGVLKSYIWHVSRNIKTDHKYNYPKNWNHK